MRGSTYKGQQTQLRGGLGRPPPGSVSRTLAPYNLASFPGRVGVARPGNEATYNLAKCNSIDTETGSTPKVLTGLSVPN